MSRTPLLTIAAENAADRAVAPLPPNRRDQEFDVPQDVQAHLDAILDYYADNALKPHIRLCGDPLHIVSSLVTQMQKTLPEALGQSGKIVLDFIIGNICAFCRDNNAGRVTFSFEFKR